MTLAASSQLFTWSSRYGAVALYGGKPVHSRNSAGRWLDQQGILQSAIVNTPRFNWATVASERRPILRLEAASTNRVLDSENMGSANWTLDVGGTRTSGQTDPFGGTAAYKITAAASGDGIENSPTMVGNGKKISVRYVRGGTVQWSWDWYDNTAATYRAQALINWAGGVPSIAAGGTAPDFIFPVEDVGGGWYRVAIRAAGIVAANTQRVFMRSNGGADSIYMCGEQAEDADAPSSYIKTTGSAISRSVDQWSFDFLAAPQAMMTYIRFVERGTIKLAVGTKFVQFGKSDDTNAQHRIAQFSGVYRVAHITAGGNVSADGPAPAVGDTVELIAVLQSDGKVEIISSINGAAAVTSGLSGALALAASWSDTKLWLNSLGSSLPGLNDFAEVKCVKFADVVGATAVDRMAELRSFEVSPAGEVINAGS